MNKLRSDTFDPQIFDYIPHRPPMLLINHISSITETRSEAKVLIKEGCPFFVTEQGVPAWIGLEYMGQTAALMAGLQIQQKTIEPHLGFLIGSRFYKTDVSYFKPGKALSVACQQIAVVGNELATFECYIKDELGEQLATANLSVFRKPITEA